MYMIIRGFIRNQFRKLRRLTWYSLKVFYTVSMVVIILKIMEMLGG